MNISRSAILPYTTRQMYDVVADIRSYPRFLNWCEASQIISEIDQEVVAKLKISYAKLNFEFTTRNINSPHQSIQLNLVDGPFSSLSGEWTFVELSKDACKVSIQMTFDFENSLTKKMMAKVFSNIIATQLEAFQSRAKVIYGARNV